MTKKANDMPMAVNLDMEIAGKLSELCFVDDGQGHKYHHQSEIDKRDAVIKVLRKALEGTKSYISVAVAPYEGKDPIYKIAYEALTQVDSIMNGDSNETN